MEYPLLIIDQRVLAAHVDFGSHEAHDLVWEVSYAPKEEGEPIRYLQTWLHGCDDDVVFSITMGALLEETGTPYSESDLEELLRQEYYASSLYSAARKSARGLLALMEEDFPLPESRVFDAVKILGTTEDEDADDIVDEGTPPHIT